MPTLGEIIVAFGIDAGYAPYLAVTIASIVANAPGAKFRFMVIHDGVPLADQKSIEACAPGHAFEWPEIKDERVLGIGTYNHITRASTYRLSIPRFAPPGAERVIYLDSDIVVLGDLRELAQVDLGDTMVGAVFDPAVPVEPFAERWGLVAEPLAYFNAGVLVLDVEKIRAADAFEPAIDHLSQRMDQFEFGDQCVLNLLFWNKWTRLEPLWNVQRRMVTEEGNPCYATPQQMLTDRRPKLIHFTETNKPWAADAYHPFVWTFWRYLRRTPYWASVNAKGQTTLFKHVRRYLKTALKMAPLKA